MNIICSQASREVDDEYHRNAKMEEKSYYGVAHTVHESVTEQATIMVNGKLKEYQVNLMKSGCLPLIYFQASILKWYFKVSVSEYVICALYF